MKPEKTIHKRPPRRLRRLVSWRTLRRNEITKKGDRRCYVGGEVGPKIYDSEIGMRAGETGYWRVVRKTKKPAKRVVICDLSYREKVSALCGGLADMASRLVACGLGPVNLGKLARHMLKCKPYKTR